MKITCKQQDLSHGLSAVSHAVSNRSTLPILANILLATDHGRLKLSATNLEIGINCWVDAQVHEEGTTTVPAKLLTDFVNSLSPAPVDITVPEDSNKINIKSEGSSANIKGLDASEFPLIPSAEGGEPPVVIDAVQLKEMIKEVAFAASEDESRPVFTGVLVQVGVDLDRTGVQPRLVGEGARADVRLPGVRRDIRDLADRVGDPGRLVQPSRG